MRKYLAEFIGTFFLVLTIGLTGIAAGAGVIAPLAIGSVSSSWNATSALSISAVPMRWPLTLSTSSTRPVIQ